LSKAFAQYIEEGNNLLLVDGLNLAFRWKARNNFPNEYNFSSRYASTVQSFANSYNASHIVVLGDMGSFRRKSVYPEYKAKEKKK
jgi:5'-3' exonuclease